MPNLVSRLIFALFRPAAVLWVALTVSAFGATHLLYDPPGWLTSLHDRDYWLQVSLIVLSACLVSLGSSLTIGFQRFDRQSFVNVFGSEVSQRTFFVSIPEYSLTTESETILTEANLPSSRDRFSPLHVDSRFKAGDLKRFIASSDIVGAGYVLDGLGRFTAEGPQFEFSRDLFAQDSSFFAFGLQPNPHTPRFAELISGTRTKTILRRDSRKPVAFPSEVQALLSVKKIISLKINPTADSRSAYLLVETDQGVLEIHQRHEWDWNLGLIILVKPSRNPQRRWVLAAGVGHGGTTGASFFLAKNWKSYASDFASPFGFDAIMSLTFTRLESRGGTASFQDQKDAVNSSTIELLRLGCRGNI